MYRRLWPAFQGNEKFLINSFVDNQLEECWRQDRCEKYRVGLRRRVLMKLDILDMATCLEDVANTPGCQVQPLRSGQPNLYTLVVDEPWRLVFRHENGGFYDVWLKQFQ
jgi:toxin HigB-1